jgi:hypothetical protein
LYGCKVRQKATNTGREKQDKRDAYLREEENKKKERIAVLRPRRKSGGW